MSAVERNEITRTVIENETPGDKERGSRWWEDIQRSRDSSAANIKVKTHEKQRGGNETACFASCGEINTRGEELNDHEALL